MSQINQMNSRLFQIFTLGCKVNQYESEEIRQALLDAGFSPIEKKTDTQKKVLSHDEKNTVEDSLPPADHSGEMDLATHAAHPEWIIVNTCAVTLESEAKSRKLIRQLIKRNQPKNMLVFGCSAENNTEQYAQIPGVTHVITGKEHGGNRVAAVLDAIGLNSDIRERSLKNGLRKFGERHRAYVKVQDGCKQFCSYCLIPHLRNELTSVPVNEVIDEIRSLLNHGYREIVLTGIHLGYYGINPRSRTQNLWTIEDRTRPRETNLTKLMECLAKMKMADGKDCPEFRLRLSSLEAHEAGDDLLQIMAENRERICPHLHLSMQSGSPAVHRRMNRPGTVEQYVERCEAAKKILDLPALTTDIIVGFPGETEKEFLETCDVVQKIGFSKIHIFPFSPRPGTPAEKMDGFIPNEEKHRRELYLAEIERETHAKFVESLNKRKKPSQFLIERFHPETASVTGTSEYYLHDEFPGTAEDVGKFLWR